MKQKKIIEMALPDLKFHTKTGCISFENEVNMLGNVKSLLWLNSNIIA